jgi:hypothetical protein
MPTRKQRRRQQKGRRHEYEYVYVDEEGREVEVDDEPDRPAKRDQKRDPRRNGKRETTGKRPARAPRKIDPPSWGRIARRAAIFGPVIFIAFYTLNKDDLVRDFVLALVYTAFFIPFMYLMDRTMYRSYLRRTGNLPRRSGRG